MKTPEQLAKHRAYQAQWAKEDRKLHPGKWKAGYRRQYLTNREKRIAYAKAWRIANPDKVKILKARYEKRNRATVNARSRRNDRRRRLDPAYRAKCNARTQIWREQNPNYKKSKKESDVNFKLREGLGSRIRLALKSGNKRFYTVNLLGCSIAECRAHLESLFKPGMAWENHSIDGWHIDHVRPCSSFDLTDVKQQFECFNYKNLQPLWATENLQKSDKWEPAVKT